MSESHLKIHSTAGKRKLLVVEDEQINLELLRMILGERYDLICAETGAEALTALERQHAGISLVLLDLNLPDMHGMDVLRRIRENEQYARIPVIVMTADRDAEVESLLIGAIDFISKPYPQPGVMHARIQRTIELSEDRATIQSTERDQLTGLYSRDYFFRYAGQMDAYNQGLDTDAIILDIRHFHMINERYGKPYGDEILRSVGERLREMIPEEEGLICRREADTFLIYCRHRTDYQDILDRVSVQSGSDSRIRLRMGVYPSVDRSIDMERRFDRAKTAADTLREGYTGTVALYDESMHEREMLAEQLLEDFHTAVREKQFRVYYQPKYDVRQTEPFLSSAEALVRWQHPVLGMVRPNIFIPLFEKNGLIRELDSYVWREAAQQVREWKDRFGISVPVSVNVSRIDMYDTGLAEHLDGLVREFGLEHRELLLEITESAYTEDSGQMIRQVNQMREKGFRIEMDDFGTGYSSLNMISTLPIDALKLDMEFIRNAFKERKDTRLLEMVIALADSLSVPTIAEGVETAEQMFTLKSMGCDIVQGYYFSPPVPAEEFARFVEERQQELLVPDWLKKDKKAGPGDRNTYDALHDPLTGMYNNSGFEILFHDSDKDHIAVMIADIDGYDRIREEKGRQYAEKVVLRTASVLRDNFRSVDDICRLKEDEFVIIMTRMTSAMRALVFDKVEEINAMLQKAEEGEMPISLSVGVAFSDRENPGGDIFEDADTALLRMKQVRSCGCAVY